MLISYYYAGNFNVRCGNAVSGNAAVGWERMKTGGRACQRRDDNGQIMLLFHPELYNSCMGLTVND